MCAFKVATDRCGHVRRAKRPSCSDHLMACPKAACLYSIIQQPLANDFGLSILRTLGKCVSKARETMDKPPFDGATGDTPGLA